MKWEYAVKDIASDILNPEGQTAILNHYGQQEWELVGIFPTQNGTFAYFKRQIPIDNTDFGKYIPEGGVSTRDMAGKTSNE